MELQTPEQIANDMYSIYLKAYSILDKGIIMSRIRAKECCKLSCREAIKNNSKKENIEFWEDVLKLIDKI